jgi:hypothetical protein
MSSNTINSTNPTIIPVDKPKRTKKVNKNPEENKNEFIEVKEDKPKKVDKVVKPKKSKKNDKLVANDVETDKPIDNVETDKPVDNIETDKPVDNIETDKLVADVLESKKPKKSSKVAEPKTGDKKEKPKRKPKNSKKDESKSEKLDNSTNPTLTESKVTSLNNVKSDSENDNDSNNIVASNVNDVNLEKLLDEKKKEWTNITAQINTINQERERLELEQKNLVKELNELMKKLQNDEVDNVFVLEQNNQVQLPKEKVTKKDIIAMNAVSDTSDSDTDSELDTVISKPKLNCKKNTRVKTMTNKTLQPPVKSLKKSKKIIDVESSDDSDSD